MINFAVGMFNKAFLQQNENVRCHFIRIRRTKEPNGQICLCQMSKRRPHGRPHAVTFLTFLSRHFSLTVWLQLPGSQRKLKVFSGCFAVHLAFSRNLGGFVQLFYLFVLVALVAKHNRKPFFFPTLQLDFRYSAWLESAHRWRRVLRLLCVQGELSPPAKAWGGTSSSAFLVKYQPLGRTTRGVRRFQMVKDLQIFE